MDAKHRRLTDLRATIDHLRTLAREFHNYADELLEGPTRGPLADEARQALAEYARQQSTSHGELAHRAIEEADALADELGMPR